MEEAALIFRKQRIAVRALSLGERIETRGLEKRDVAFHAPLTFKLDGDGFAVVFRYGSVVLFDVPWEAEEAFKERIADVVRNPRVHPDVETAEILLEEGAGERIEGDLIVLPAFSMLHLQVIADVMGKSVVLDSYERRVARSLDSMEPLARKLANGGRWGVRTRDLLRHIGEVLSDEQHMVGRVEVTEKPEFLWEHSDFERFYARLEDEFEIRERQLALERKLGLISRTAETVLNIVQAKRTIRVEWYIVILIVVEIVLMVYELLRSPHL